MMKLTFIALLCVCGMCLFMMCNGSKKTADSEVTLNDREAMANPKYRLAPSTQLFVNDLITALGDGELASFKPTNELYQKHQMSASNDTVRIGGFINIGSSFDHEKCRSLNIQLAQQTDKVCTVQVPLISLPAFLQLDGIEYFQLTEKIHPKN